jgi:hypothetical protein
MYVEGANPCLSALLVNSIFHTSLFKKVLKFVASSAFPLRLCSVLMLPQSGTCQHQKPDARKRVVATRCRYRRGLSFGTEKEDLRNRRSRKKSKSREKPLRTYVDLMSKDNANWLGCIKPIDIAELWGTSGSSSDKP